VWCSGWDHRHHRVQTSYAIFAQTLKWLTAVPLRLRRELPSWRTTHLAGRAHATVVPDLSLEPGAPWAPTWAFSATTISPYYLFFWQATQEVEEEKRRGKEDDLPSCAARPS
jgi:hypothetical protein